MRGLGVYPVVALPFKKHDADTKRFQHSGKFVDCMAVSLWVDGFVKSWFQTVRMCSWNHLHP